MLLTVSLIRYSAKKADIEPLSAVSISSDADFGDEQTKISAYVWDENMRPLSETKTFVLNEPPKWSILRENGANYTVNSASSVTIMTQSGDLWGKSDNNGTAKNMYLIVVPEDIADSFTAEVTVKCRPGVDYQRAGLIAYAGDGDNVTVMRRFHSAYNGNVFMTTMNTAGIAGPENIYTADNGGEECKLRLTKSGSEFRGYFSVDNGVTWNELETRIQSNIANAENFKIGFYASNGEYEADSVPVTFENFTLNGRVLSFDDGSLYDEEAVTNEQFVTILVQSSSGAAECVDGQDYMEWALSNNIITDSETENADEPITRQSAARIIHEMLVRYYNEPDDVNWTEAEALADLYDCHTCVMHIAQVYVKGIMTGYGDGLFHGTDKLTVGEAAAAIKRLTEPSLRTVPQITEDGEDLVTLAEAYEMMKNGAVLVDVRPAEDYAEGHIKSSVSIPIDNIIADPKAAFAGFTPEDTIIVYCRMGTNSRRAARILNEAGYINVWDLGGIEGKDYELTAE
ncbi:MAG: rhodanese-like domain-containing protein [Candidatus Ornithomonoglobus sp.]